MNIIKVAVGARNLKELQQFLKAHAISYGGGSDGEGQARQSANIVRTRTRPVQAENILAAKGSLYRVVKGNIVCRQQILDFLHVDNDYEQKAYHIVVSSNVIPTHIVPMRPFQGWRYLKPEDAPKDLQDDDNTLELELQALGII